MPLVKVLITSRTTHRLFLVVTLLILPFSYIAYQAVQDPEIKFLAISLGADWALHPMQEIVDTPGKLVSKDVAFRTQFDFGNLPSSRASALDFLG